jgi:1-phosphofructokinase/tagatose 6-phosphate kinase
VALDLDGSAWRGRSSGGGAYSVGSGDAFLAGLVVALEGGLAGRRALAVALAAGAANAEQPGPGRLDPRRVERLAEGAGVDA